MAAQTARPSHQPGTGSLVGNPGDRGRKGDGDDPRKGKQQAPGRAHEKEKVAVPEEDRIYHDALQLRDDVAVGREKELLRAHPEVQRGMLWRDAEPGRVPRIERYNINKAHYAVPAQAHIRGRKLVGHVDRQGVTYKKECASCRAGNGPWTECRVLPKWFRYDAEGEEAGAEDEACTNCAFGDHGRRCAARWGATVSDQDNPPRPQTSAPSTPGKRSAASSSTRTAHGREFAFPSAKPHTVFNQGVNTRSTAQLEEQNRRLQAQQEANAARIRALRSRQDPQRWSNDTTSTRHSRGDSSSSFRGLSPSERMDTTSPSPERSQLHQPHQQTQAGEPYGGVPPSGGGGERQSGGASGGKDRQVKERKKK